jgi:hypothetical protein
MVREGANGIVVTLTGRSLAREEPAQATASGAVPEIKRDRRGRRMPFQRRSFFYPPCGATELWLRQPGTGGSFIDRLGATAHTPSASRSESELSGKCRSIVQCGLCDMAVQRV